VADPPVEPGQVWETWSQHRLEVDSVTDGTAVCVVRPLAGRGRWVSAIPTREFAMHRLVSKPTEERE
jgi:hypothetical protein